MRRRLRKAESGAMAIFIALVTCFVVIPLGALAVDLGMQRVSRVDAQAIADTTALDMARLLASGGTVDNAAATSAASRSSGAVGSNLVVKAYTGTLSNSFISDQSLGCKGTTNNAYFTATSTSPNAVLVVVTNRVSFAIHGGSGAVCRSAIANAYQQACMVMDSFAAAINTGDSAALSILNRALGTNVQSSVLSSNGVLTAGINVLDFLNVLKTNLALATTDQVLAANVTAAQVNAAAVTVLNNTGNTLSATALQSLGTGITATGTTTVGSILGISTGTGSALTALVNPLDLLVATAQLANGTTPLTASATSSNLTGLALDVHVGSRPVPVCLGDVPPTKTMSQTYIHATANINAPGSLTSAVTNLTNGLTGLLSTVVGTLGSLLGGSTYTVNSVTLGPIEATLRLAAATGKVNSLTCNGATPTGMNVQEGSTLVPATVTIPIIIREKRSYGLLGSQSEFQTSTFKVTISTVSQADKSVAATLNLPADMNVPKAGPANDLSLQNLYISTTSTQDATFSTGYSVIGQLLNGSSAVLNQVQNTLLSTITSTVVSPLLTTLTNTLKTTVGATVAGSTYMATQASCNTPKLAG